MLTKPISVYVEDFFSAENPVAYYEALSSDEQAVIGKSLHKVVVDGTTKTLILSNIVSTIKNGSVVEPTYVIKHPQKKSFKTVEKPVEKKAEAEELITVETPPVEETETTTEVEVEEMIQEEVQEVEVESLELEDEATIEPTVKPVITPGRRRRTK